MVGLAHAVDEHAMNADDEPAGAEDGDEEGTIKFDLSGLTDEQSHAFVFAAHASGFKVRPTFWPAADPKPWAKPKALGQAEQALGQAEGFWQATADHTPADPRP